MTPPQTAAALDHPLSFLPRLKQVIWGGDKIAAFKRLDTSMSRIGESWEVSAIEGMESVVSSGPFAGLSLPALAARFGEELLGHRVARRYGGEFPLLVKYIDAASDLSVQVHPDDELALRRHGSRGKTEMWHILSNDPGARLYVGNRRPLSRFEYMEMIAGRDTVMQMVDTYETAPADTYLISAGRIHAIGAGNFLVEVQESSDITYRIYDFGRLDTDGRPRELHTDLAIDAIDYTLIRGCKLIPPKGEHGGMIADCNFFTVWRHEVVYNRAIPCPEGTFMILMCVAGSATVSWPGGSAPMPEGTTLLFPAAIARSVSASGPAGLLAIAAK